MKFFKLQQKLISFLGVSISAATAASLALSDPDENVFRQFRGRYTIEKSNCHQNLNRVDIICRSKRDCLLEIYSETGTTSRVSEIWHLNEMHEAEDGYFLRVDTSGGMGFAIAETSGLGWQVDLEMTKVVGNKVSFVKKVTSTRENYVCRLSLQLFGEEMLSIAKGKN